MTWSKERREAMSARMRGLDNPMRKPDVDEKHKKVCAKNGPKEGLEHHFYGKTHTEELRGRYQRIVE